MPDGWWTALMHADHGWFARHQSATVALVLVAVFTAPGVIECLC